MSPLTHSSATRSLPAPARTAVLALGAQSALALGYLWVSPAGLSTPAMLAVPLVWVTVAAVAVRHAHRPAASRRVRWLAAGVGVGVLAVLAFLATLALAGTLGPTLAMGQPSLLALGIGLLLPPFGSLLRGVV